MVNHGIVAKIMVSLCTILHGHGILAKIMARSWQGYQGTFGRNQGRQPGVNREHLTSLDALKISVLLFFKNLSKIVWKKSKSELPQRLTLGTL